jgi:hypothetical protein
MRTSLAGSGRWIAWGAFALLAARLVARTSRFAVDLPYYDQWDLWNPLFAGDGPWTFFWFQWGPVRQGLGGLALLASATLSGWSTRAETFMSAGFVIAGAALFMVAAQRIRGRLDALDALLPLLLLDGLAADAITEAPNPAHGPVPYLLLCAAPLCFAVRRERLRLPLLVALTGALTYTGFAIVAVPLVLVAQAIDAWRSPQRRAPAVALVASVLLALPFFIGYARNPAVPCFVFPDPQPLRYLPFAGLVLAHPLAFDPLRDGMAVAVLVSAALVGAFAWSAGRLLRPRPGAELGRLVFFLCGSAVLFAAAVAVGRACLGVAAAWAPRYVLYVMPALAAAALLLREWSGRGGRWVTAALLILCVGQQVGVELQSSGFAELASKKRRYVSCLRAGRTATQCTADIGLPVYPEPAVSHLDEKVEYMRERGLGPF